MGIIKHRQMCIPSGGVIILRKLQLLEFLDCFYKTFIQEGMVSILHSIMEANALVSY